MKIIELFERGKGGIKIAERPMPQPKLNHSIIRIKAASLNRVDIYMRDDGRGITHKLPQIMGVDGAGMIEQSGETSGFKKNDKVLIYPYHLCGQCKYCQSGQHTLCDNAKILGEHIDGTFCEYICVPDYAIAKLDDDCDIIAAGGLGVAYLTAWGMVFDKGKLKKGQKILVQGAGGGVSCAAITLAINAGAEVFATTNSPNKIKYFENLGVKVFDYKTQDAAKEIMKLTDKQGVDLVIDNVGGDTFDISLRALAKGGRAVICGATNGTMPPIQLQRMFVRQLSVHGSTMANLNSFHEMVRAFNEGKIKVTIDSIFPMSDFGNAFERLESKERIGKIILKI